MLYLAIAIFALAAVMGIIIAAAILGKKPETPKAVVYTHGILAATGLGLLIFYAVNNPENYPQVSLMIFIVAALGGFVLFFNDMKKKPGPAALVFIHALAAVTAFILLLMFAFF
jgi:hypothetical protein